MRGLSFELRASLISKCCLFGNGSSVCFWERGLPYLDMSRIEEGVCVCVLHAGVMWDDDSLNDDDWGRVLISRMFAEHPGKERRREGKF